MAFAGGAGAVGAGGGLAGGLFGGGATSAFGLSPQTWGLLGQAGLGLLGGSRDREPREPYGGLALGGPWPGGRGAPQQQNAAGMQGLYGQGATGVRGMTPFGGAGQLGGMNVMPGEWDWLQGPGNYWSMMGMGRSAQHPWMTPGFNPNVPHPLYGQMGRGFGGQG